MKILNIIILLMVASLAVKSLASPYSNVREALDKCGAELRAATMSGKYNHLSDYEMAKAMERDNERCMARYGHYPK